MMRICRWSWHARTTSTRVGGSRMTWTGRASRRSSTTTAAARSSTRRIFARPRRSSSSGPTWRQDDKVADILNRVVDWHDDELWREADPRHVEKMSEDIGLEDFKLGAVPEPSWRRSRKSSVNWTRTPHEVPEVAPSLTWASDRSTYLEPGGGTTASLKSKRSCKRRPFIAIRCRASASGSSLLRR